jgi:endoglucanase
MIFTKTTDFARSSYKVYLFVVVMLLFFRNHCIAQNTDYELRKTDNYGQLHIEGTHLLNQQNDIVTLEGMSLFWSQWMGKYYNYNCIKWLRDDWHCEVIRAAMGVEYGGYLKHSEREKRKIIEVIETCIDLGIYVIVDWHSHNAHEQTNEAVRFFSEIAKLYGNYPNIIYEIYNEPEIVSWDSIVKPYCETVITAIRMFDPDNIIIVGSPAWSQDVDAAADNPIIGKNIAYSLHFYAGTHSQWLRDKADYAMGKGLALWVTEFGTCSADGKGAIVGDELENWFNFINAYNLSWCNWSVSDKQETASILKPGAKKEGGWPESILTESGKLIKTKMLLKNP